MFVCSFVPAICGRAVFFFSLSSYQIFHEGMCAKIYVRDRTGGSLEPTFLPIERPVLPVASAVLPAGPPGGGPYYASVESGPC